MAKLGKSADEGWKGLLSKAPLPENFDAWLEERFDRRAPSAELISIADAPFSAIFTSSVDPGWANLLAVSGREPEPILIGDPLPPIARSKRRPPIFFLFGRAGPGPSEAKPPSTLQALAQRRLRHAANMLRNVNEVTTPVGLVIVDGYAPQRDWLKPEDLLAVLSGAPTGGVLWCGDDPTFSEDDQELFDQLIADGIVVRETRPFGTFISELRASTEISAQSWDDPDIVTLPSGEQLITSPKMRLTTQASAVILDDSVAGFQAPLEPALVQGAFESFHSIPSSVRARIEGVRREFAIEREFENSLEQRVRKALRQHHRESGALLLHGQSGSGKSVALARLAVRVRQEHLAAVLFSSERMPSAADLSAFLSEVDRRGAVTLIIVDVPLRPVRFDELLEALRSRGHRVVVLGSSYRIEKSITQGEDRFIEAPDKLSSREQDALSNLANKYGVVGKIPTKEPHALALLYWQLPGSRRLLAQGLGREARASQTAISRQGTKAVIAKEISTLGMALIKAGYSATMPAFGDDQVASEDLAGSSSAAKVIDYIMAASRLFKSVPVNLVLRAVLQARTTQTAFGIELIHDIFKDQDLFRWHYADEHGEELQVGARLQLEAELICNSRLSGPIEEASKLIELISQSYRAGSEGHEETKFVVDIVYALGPDGPFGERYKDSYADIASALSSLREKNGVLNARLMLQEATLRRSYIRTHDELFQRDKERLLDEASKAIDHALQLLDQTGSRRLYASKRTQEYLWVERAATYGYLATDAARRNASATEVWSSYRAAREAGRKATSRVDTYYPLDIALWMPLGVLKDGTQLGEMERREIEADIQSVLDVVDPNNLPPDQEERFQRQRLNLAHVLKDEPLSEAAFQELVRLGSTAGFYLRAKAMAPERPETGEMATDAQVTSAEAVRKYLWTVFDQVRSDPRCLALLLSSEWVVGARRWLFRGTRQPIPFSEDALRRMHGVLLEILAVDGHGAPPRYRYLEAVLRWLTGSESEALHSWRHLAADTEYVERGRVLNRHTMYTQKGVPRIFSGIVERQIGASRWSVIVPELRRHVDLAEGRGDQRNISPGQALSGFAISFNYIGPIADFNIENS